MSPTKPDETRDGVPLTNLDQPLFDGAEATKRDLVDYLDGVRDRILPELEDRPLSVIRVHRGQEAFMQKNVPKYTPDWVPTVPFWAETSKREVSYALCNDRRTLLWFANQRAVEYHPALVRASQPDRMTHLILDLDPPEGDSFPKAVQAARLVRQVLDDLGLEGAVKTSGAKGLHVFVPIDDDTPDRGRGGRHPRHRGARRRPRTRRRHHRVREGRARRQGVRRLHPRRRRHRRRRLQPAGAPGRAGVVPGERGTTSTPSRPADFTVHTALEHLGDRDPWAEQMPAPQAVPEELVEEGDAIPVGRVAAMHEGKRRKRAPSAG